jgi:hypothetical protein
VAVALGLSILFTAAAVQAAPGPATGSGASCTTMDLTVANRTDHRFELEVEGQDGPPRHTLYPRSTASMHFSNLQPGLSTMRLTPLEAPPDVAPSSLSWDLPNCGSYTFSLTLTKP